MTGPYSTLLYDLGNERYKVTNPIPIVISRTERRATYEDYMESDFTVEWPEMDIMGYGATEQVAINQFREEVISMFQRIVDIQHPDISTPEFRILRHCVTDLRR